MPAYIEGEIDEGELTDEITEAIWDTLNEKLEDVSFPATVDTFVIKLADRAVKAFSKQNRECLQAESEILQSIGDLDEYT